MQPPRESGIFVKQVLLYSVSGMLLLLILAGFFHKILVGMWGLVLCGGGLLMEFVAMEMWCYVVVAGICFHGEMMRCGLNIRGSWCIIFFVCIV